MIPDFDNIQKWRSWFRKKPIFKIWEISPIILTIIILFLFKANNQLKNDIERIKTEITPIKELYPKLELSAAVAKIIEDYKILKQEITQFKEKEKQKIFKPLSDTRKDEISKALEKLTQKYSDINFLFKIYCVNPNKDHFNKAQELVTIFNDSNIAVEYSNTIMSANQNLFLQYHPDLPQQILNEVAKVLKVAFKFDKISIKPGARDNKDKIDIYFLGNPLFDDEGRVFYTN